jgi:translocation and assembly module TamB
MDRRHWLGPGLVAFRANLERVAAVRPLDPLQIGRIDPTGELVGNIKLASHAGQVMAIVDLTVNQLALRQQTAGLPGAPPIPQVFWQEPSLSLKGTVGYHPADDRLTFDGLRGQSQTIAAAAGGSISKLTTSRDLNVAGTIDYDLARLTPIVAKYVGEGVKLNGRDQAHFELSGRLAPSPVPLIQPVSSETSSSDHWASGWRGRVLAPWQSMSIYGLPVGPGRIAAQMGDGQVAIEPLAFTVAQGQFSASPQVALAPAPGEITLPAGPLLTSVQLTPEVSEELLKYFVPYLSGATRTNGQFSIRLDAGRVPLGNPRAATFAGQLNLHSVKVGPGPEISRLLGLGFDLQNMLTKGGVAALLGATPQKPVTLLSITDRRIDFWVEQERIYHQGIEFGSDDLVFRSRGSVGFDQTVSVKIEIPIQEKWVRGVPLFHHLVGKSIELPVGGTLTKLEWDKGALLQELKRLGFSGASGGAIGNEINNALDKLLGGRKPQ